MQECSISPSKMVSSQELEPTGKGNFWRSILSSETGKDGLWSGMRLIRELVSSRAAAELGGVGQRWLLRGALFRNKKQSSLDLHACDKSSQVKHVTAVCRLQGFEVSGFIFDSNDLSSGSNFALIKTREVRSRDKRSLPSYETIMTEMAMNMTVIISISKCCWISMPVS